jgi:phospholipase/carboxylesterase
VSRIAKASLFAALLALAGCDRRPEEPAGPRVEAAASATAAIVDQRGDEAGGVRFLTYYVGGAKAGEKLPTVVALHGRGDRPDNYAARLTRLKEKARLIAAFGVLPTEDKGYQWFEVDHSPGRPPSTFDRAADAMPKVIAMLTELPKKLPIKGKPILTGFSQGAVMAHIVAAHRPDLISLAAPVAGLLPPALVTAAAPADAGALPRIVAFHGDVDSIVPIAWDHTSVEAEKKAGFHAELRVFPKVDHAFSNEEEADYMNLLEDQIRRLAAATD